MIYILTLEFAMYMFTTITERSLSTSTNTRTTKHMHQPLDADLESNAVTTTIKSINSCTSAPQESA